MNFILKLALASIIMISGGYGIHQRTQIHEQRLEMARLKQQVTNAEMRLQRTQADRDEAVRLASGPSVASGEDPVPASGDDVFDEAMRKLLERVYQFKKWVESKPELNLPELEFGGDAQWFDVVARTQFKGEEDYYRAAYALKRDAQFEFLSILTSALRDYLQSSHGQLPTDIAQLGPFLVHPVDNKLLARYEMAAAGTAQDVPLPTPLIREKIIPSEHRTLDTVNINGMHVSIEEVAFDDPPLPGSLSPEEKASLVEARKAMQAQKQAIEACLKFQRDHGGAKPTDVQELLPYVNDSAVLKNFKLRSD